ncbi:MAG: histidine kinase [Bacteroidia bacterium]|nr:histidine kinase [Bacteroidia bacterium]
MSTTAAILFIDDEPNNLTAFKASFRKSYQVFTANSGREALSILENEADIAAVVSDQRMPGMTGVELLKEVKERFPEPKRIILTGYSDVDAIVKSINEAQAWQYLTKPWVYQDLKLILDRAVESWQLGRENRNLQVEKAELQLQTEQQEKQQILSRFETLRNQVNPHFLFNSLNTLSTLIHEDPVLAEAFISRLTRVYRYVLELDQEITVPLEQELGFVKHYLFLQQIRFDNALQVYTQVPEKDLGRHLPPMTLQLLVENAVKHNIVSKSQPLMVELLVEGEHFVVKNTYQPRNEVVVSTHVGLANLSARYELLGTGLPEFGRQGAHFVAKVPLLSDR